jgi:hypothetical protein
MPKPKPNESESDFVSRCIETRQNENPDESTKQSSAVCYSMYKEHKKKLEKIEELVEPGTGTSHGMVGATPESVVPGQYPEFPEVEIPENLKKKPWERDFD